MYHEGVVTNLPKIFKSRSLSGKEVYMALKSSPNHGITTEYIIKRNISCIAMISPKPMCNLFNDPQNSTFFIIPYSSTV